MSENQNMIHTHRYTHTHTMECDSTLRKTHIYNGILFHLNKEGNPAICDNTIGSIGHYAKKNKPDTERQILYFLKHIEAESRIVVTRSLGKGN